MSVVLVAGLSVVGAGVVNAASGMSSIGAMKAATGLVVLSSVVLAARRSTEPTTPVGSDGQTSDDRQYGPSTSVGFYTMVTIGTLQLGLGVLPSDLAVSATVLAGLLTAGGYEAVRRLTE